MFVRPAGRAKENADGAISHATIRSAAAPHSERKSGEAVPLSERELEVLRHVARGYTCREIGQMLFLSVRTVETYRMRLMHKLGVKSRSELVEYAMQHELI